MNSCENESKLRKGNFDALRNRFLIRQEQVNDRNRVEELNKPKKMKLSKNDEQLDTNLMGTFIFKDEVSKYDDINFEVNPNISKEVRSFKARVTTPPKKFVCSPHSNIFKKYRKFSTKFNKQENDTEEFLSLYEFEEYGEDLKHDNQGFTGEFDISEKENSSSDENLENTGDILIDM